jgi:hypothetical protein
MPDIQKTPDFHFHAYSEGLLWASKGNRILASHDGEERFFVYMAVPAGWGKARCGLLNRLMRWGIHQVVPLTKDDLLVVVKGKLLFVRHEKISHERLLERGSRPLRTGICVTPDGSIIYGDYWANPRRETVRLYLSRDRGRTWDILWQSGQSSTRHIHLVQPVEGAPDDIYFSTGDYGPEPALYRMNIRTRQLRRIGGGSQVWRMLALLQVGRQLVWGSDCEYEQNYIYRFDLNKDKLIRLQKLPGPAYYAVQDRRGNYYLATTVENRNRHRACILNSTDGTVWHPLRCFQKDIWPPRYFGYGTIEFIRGQENLDTLWINLRGLKEIRK